MALADYPESDALALARIADRLLRDTCFVLVRAYRQRAPELLEAMIADAREAVALGHTRIGGIRLAGRTCLSRFGLKIENGTACFFVYVIALTHPDLAPYLESDGEPVQALRLAGWQP